MEKFTKEGESPVNFWLKYLFLKPYFKNFLSFLKLGVIFKLFYLYETFIKLVYKSNSLVYLNLTPKPNPQKPKPFFLSFYVRICRLFGNIQGSFPWRRGSIPWSGWTPQTPPKPNPQKPKPFFLSFYVRICRLFGNIQGSFPWRRGSIPWSGWTPQTPQT